MRASVLFIFHRTKEYCHLFNISLAIRSPKIGCFNMLRMCYSVRFILYGRTIVLYIQYTARGFQIYGPWKEQEARISKNANYPPNNPNDIILQKERGIIMPYAYVQIGIPCRTSENVLNNVFIRTINIRYTNTIKQKAYTIYCSIYMSVTYGQHTERISPTADKYNNLFFCENGAVHI